MDTEGPDAWAHYESNLPPTGAEEGGAHYHGDHHIQWVLLAIMSIVFEEWYD